MHLVAVQSKLQIAGRQRLARIGRGWLGLPRPFIPDDDLARAILFLGDRAFKTRIRNRMVFHLHGHAFVARVVAGAFRHGPAFHRAIEFQPKIIVQTAGPVLLDDKGEHVVRILVAPCRLGRDGEIAFGLIRFQGGFHGGPMR
ncbi:hypothetical protein D3C81_1709820 [compost metagenome]